MGAQRLRWRWYSRSCRCGGLYTAKEGAVLVAALKGGVAGGVFIFFAGGFLGVLCLADKTKAAANKNEGCGTKTD